jgi:hypothetical protein
VHDQPDGLFKPSYFVLYNANGVWDYSRDESQARQRAGHQHLQHGANNQYLYNEELEDAPSPTLHMP